MVDEEVVKSVRLSPEEASLLDENDINFSDFVRDSLDKKKKEKKLHSKKELVNKLIANGAFAIIGLALLTALNFSSNLLTVCIVGGLGGFFLVVGAYNLYLAIKEVNIYGRK